MKKIGLISDTHNYFDSLIPKYFSEVDEIWHAGDIGSLEIMDQLNEIAPVLGVYGNIDNHLIRAEYPRDLRWECEGLDIFMTHIGGYPGRYTKRVGELLRENPPQLYICGHSHILKVMPDKNLGLLHMNPGAAGVHGFHRMKTLIRFEIENGNIQNLEVVELGKRGTIR